MKLNPDIVTAVGGHGHRPRMPDRQIRDPQADRPAFPQVVSQVRPQAAGLHGAEAPGRFADSPAHLARAGVLANGAQPSVPFGWIVSAIARGLEPPVLAAGDGDGATAAAEAAAGISEPPAAATDADTEPTVNPLQEAAEQVADNLAGGTEPAMADILDELLDSSEETA